MPDDSSNRSEMEANNNNVDGRFKKKYKAPTMGAAIQHSLSNWPKFVADNSNHINEAGIILHSYQIDYTHSGEHEDAIRAREIISRQKDEMLEKQRQLNIEREEARKQRHKEEGGEYTGDENVDEEIYEEDTGRIQTIIPEWIEPYEWTKPIKAGGWYRMCVQGPNDITVEMDIRSSVDLGGIDRETGHVFTHDEREAIDEEERILGLKNKEPTLEEEEAKALVAELEKALKDQVKDYDLDATRKLIKEVNDLVSQMQKHQSNVHNRIKGHENDARRNYKRIVRSGMIETVLYLVITLFQIYTVHKWLLSNNALGR